MGTDFSAVGGDKCGPSSVHLTHGIPFFRDVRSVSLCVPFSSLIRRLAPSRTYAFSLIRFQQCACYLCFYSSTAAVVASSFTPFVTLFVNDGYLWHTSRGSHRRMSALLPLSALALSRLVLAQQVNHPLCRGRNVFCLLLLHLCSRLQRHTTPKPSLGLTFGTGDRPFVVCGHSECH